MTDNNNNRSETTEGKIVPHRKKEDSEYTPFRNPFISQSLMSLPQSEFDEAMRLATSLDDSEVSVTRRLLKLVYTDPIVASVYHTFGNTSREVLVAMIEILVEENDRLRDLIKDQLANSSPTPHRYRE